MRILLTDDNVWNALSTGSARLPSWAEVIYLPVSDRDALLAALPTVEAYVGVHFDSEFASVATQLRLLHVTAAGTDHIPADDIAATVTIVNSYGHGRSVAEHVVMTMLAVRRELLWRDRELRQGRWRSRMIDPSVSRFDTLEGSTVAVVGTGHIGVATAQLCSAMGTRVIGIRGRDLTDPQTDVEPYAWVGGPRHRDQALREADYLVLACPLDEQTRGMIGAPQLELLGEGGVLVNVGRGGLVDEPALYTALLTRRIAGAALDVWQTDASADPHPASPLPFHELPNVIMTPHFSASADSTYTRRAAEVAASLEAVAAGRVPRNCIRPGIVGALR